MVVRKNIHKPKNDEHSIVVYNYPYQALEESLVNAYYHRRYDEYQPVEVNIMPDMIEIISYGGAERSIKLDDLRAGKRVHARRYRNPRLGEFLKELHLTEGRGTGFPTIHEELKKNGSPDSIIEADDEHTYFIIRIPCHPEFVCEELGMDKEGHILPIEEIRDKEKDVTDDVTDVIYKADESANAPKTKRFTKPSLEEVRAYCAERKNNVNAEKFIDYYESNGWKVGKNPMKDWKAAVRNWEKSNFAKPDNKDYSKCQNDDFDISKYETLMNRFDL
jgi:predicted HTH transcriptional regulator